MSGKVYGWTVYVYLLTSDTSYIPIEDAERDIGCTLKLGTALFGRVMKDGG